MVMKLEEMLTEQINGILGRIDEEEEEYDDSKLEILTTKDLH
jgi:hypothetical protein